MTEPETGTVAAAPLLLLSVTTAPPTGAALVSVTVPVLCRAADQYGRVHRQGTQQRVHDEPD